MKALIISLLLSVALGCGAAKAQEPVRPVLSAYTIEAGSAHVAQTYLSPLRHSGWDLALSYERMQAMRFNPDDFVMRLSGRLSGARTTNIPARNALLWKLNLALDWSMMWRRSFGAWSIYAGGYTGIDGGALYLPRNGNNPAQARLSVDLTPSASAAWRFAVGRTACKAVYEVAVPLAGVMFSPNYGQSYYEIFSRGNYDHNVVPTTVGCAPSLRQLLALDITLGRTALRLGYMGDVRQAEVNNLKQHTYNHMFVLGMVRRFTICRMQP